MVIDPKHVDEVEALALWLSGDMRAKVEALAALLRARDLLSALKAERFDPQRNEVTLHGVRYAIALFEHLGVAPVGEWVRIEKREDETLTLRRAAAPDWPTEREEMLEREKTYKARRRTFIEMKRERDEAVALLRSIESHGPMGGEFKHPSVHSCPACGKPRGIGRQEHTADCRLAAVLGRGT